MNAPEQMVWAATFVHWREKNMANPPHRLHVPGNEEAVRKFELGCATDAAEHACYAVMALRNAAKDAPIGHGEDSPVTWMIRQVVSK